MPKATKDIKKDNLKNEKESISKVSKKLSSKKKSTTQIKDSKQTTKSKNTSKIVKNASATKSSKTTTSTKKAKASTSKKEVASKVKKLENNIVAEYYDLPYRYNETIVKILYQTPNVLFVYWDISDYDRNKFINNYGENFFNDTKPILKIFNLTKNYNFEIDINDFANSWYIHVNDANCNYKVELARKPIQFKSNIDTNYIYVSSSNNIEFPNDHILLEELPENINFKNVKTNQITTKNISTLRFVGIKRVNSIYNFYKKLYKDEILEEINNKKLINPSSSSWTSV